METRLPCRLRKKRLTGADPHGKSGSDRETRRERKQRGEGEERGKRRGVRGEGKVSRVKRKGEGVTHCETPST